MTLSDSFNKHSAEWRELKGLITRRKEDLTKRLVAKNCDETRGRIKALEEILSLDDVDPVDNPQDTFI
jgi:ferritin-like metal-binding protein YciE